jgi:hypothetical protein
MNESSLGEKSKRTVLFIIRHLQSTPLFFFNGGKENYYYSSEK